MGTQPVTRLTEEEYLRIERAAAYKSEFVDGEMFAMAGGSSRHSTLAANAIADLVVQLRGKRCRVFTSDMRIRTPKSGTQLYPDLSVTCGPTQFHLGSTDIMVNPTLIVEVLSPTTKNYDRGMKFELYREIPTLRHYLILHQASIFAEHYAKHVDSSWILREYRGPDASIPLPEIECELQLGNVYDRVMDEPS